MTQHVLLVLSDASERDWVANLLSQEGLVVIPTEDGFEAMERLEGLLPDLFLIDVNLMGLNGIEICHLLRERPQYAQTPIFLIAEKGHALIPEAERLSVASLFQKPLVRESLLQGVREVLGLDIPPQKRDTVANPILPIPPIPEDETVRIEDLLGWETPAKKIFQRENETSPGFEPPEPVFQRTEAAVEQKRDEPSTPFLPVEHALESLWSGQGIENLIRMNTAGDSREKKELSEMIMDNKGPTTEASLSNPAWNSEEVRALIEKKAQAIIEMVVREVVPRIAEIEVKKEIERLKKED